MKKVLALILCIIISWPEEEVHKGKKRNEDMKSFEYLKFWEIK